MELDVSGSGSLRWALTNAVLADTIVFNPMVFPPDNPTTIHVVSALPTITQGELTIDASNSGVILRGDSAPGACGLKIESSQNRIIGLRIYGYERGICVPGDYNIIGGNRSIGSGPVGQVNVVSDNQDSGMGTDGEHIIVVGNLVGTDTSDVSGLYVDEFGISIESGANNSVGPANAIAYSSSHGFLVDGNSGIGNTIGRNFINASGGNGIRFENGGNSTLPAPVVTISTVDIISGTAPPDATIEIFSDIDDEGAVYEVRTSRTAWEVLPVKSSENSKDQTSM